MAARQALALLLLAPVAFNRLNNIHGSETNRIKKYVRCYDSKRGVAMPPGEPIRPGRRAVLKGSLWKVLFPGVASASSRVRGPSSVDSKAADSNPSRILDEIVGLVQRYYLYSDDKVVGTTPETRRFDMEKWLKVKESLVPLASKSEEDARLAAKKLMRAGNFDGYSKFLPPKTLTGRVQRFTNLEEDAAGKNRVSSLPGDPPQAGLLTSGSSEIKIVDESIGRPSGVRSRITRIGATRALVVRIPLFSANVARDTKEALRRALEADVDEIILDLRHNKGGNIEEGLSTASLFLPTEANVALLIDVNDTQWKKVSKAATDPVAEIPTIVLVDGSTASAAEMVSATLQDNCRAILVGRRTYGKARVQGVFSLSDGSG